MNKFMGMLMLVVSLLLGQKAGAQIIYTDLSSSPITVLNGSYLYFNPIDGKAAAGFPTFPEQAFIMAAASSSSAGRFGATFGGFQPLTDGSGNTLSLTAGTSIDSTGSFQFDSNVQQPPFTTGITYVGFFVTGDYGWAQVAFDSTAQTATLYGFAYESSGGAILAGDTGSISAPEPSTWAMLGLGLGALFVVARRRSRPALA